MNKFTQYYENKFVGEALTFDDVLVTPSYSEILPSDVITSTKLTNSITLNIPIVSAAMDTVTEARLAIAMAQVGGLGFIHKNMSIEKQADEVDKVKRSESGMIVDPITINPDQTIGDAWELMTKYKISGIPVVKNGKLCGILTNRDLRFVKDTSSKVSEYMTSENLVTVPVGTSFEDAVEHLHKHRIEKLLVVDDNYCLKGLITIKDINYFLLICFTTSKTFLECPCAVSTVTTSTFLLTSSATLSNVSGAVPTAAPDKSLPILSFDASGYFKRLLISFIVIKPFKQ